MQVFISWSGDLSRRVAAALHGWLPNVLQGLKPWLSEFDIPKGSFWSRVLHDELKSTRFGIVCVTPENVESPWVLYEAGAMVGRNLKVAPFLTGLRETNVTGPLTQLQITEPERADVLELVRSINSERGEATLSDNQLEATFAKWWPDLDAAIAASIQAAGNPAAPAVRPVPDMIAEILELTRGISKNVADLPYTPRQSFLFRSPVTGKTGATDMWTWKLPKNFVRGPIILEDFRNSVLLDADESGDQKETLKDALRDVLREAAVPPSEPKETGGEAAGSSSPEPARDEKPDRPPRKPPGSKPA